jgi:small subunit ribosomal protein S14
MAKTSWINDAQRKHKFGTRDYHRCSLCGRRRGYMRKFGLCRICFRENALQGNIPGVRKSSW